MKHKSVQRPTLSPSLVNTLNFTPDVTTILYGAHVTATLLSSAINISHKTENRVCVGQHWSENSTTQNCDSLGLI